MLRPPVKGLARMTKREAPRGQLHEGDTKAPDVRGDVVVLPINPFWGHVAHGPNDGASLGVDQLHAIPKVAQLDFSVGVQEDVGGLQVPVDHVQVLVKVDQTIQDLQSDMRVVMQEAIYLKGNLAEDGLRDGAGEADDVGEGAQIHVLQEEAYLELRHYGPIIVEDVRGAASLQGL